MVSLGYVIQITTKAAVDKLLGFRLLARRSGRDLNALIPSTIRLKPSSNITRGL